LIACIFATVALRHGATLLAHDVGLARIADVLNLPLDDALLLGS
jgi:hypothetical protein